MKKILSKVRSRKTVVATVTVSKVPSAPKELNVDFDMPGCPTKYAALVLMAGLFLGIHKAAVKLGAETGLTEGEVNELLASGGGKE